MSTPDIVETFGEPDTPLFDGYRYEEEHFGAVQSIVCDEHGDAQHCGITIPTDVTPIVHEEGNIGGVYIEDDILPGKTWETLGETGLVWVEEGESLFEAEMPECVIRSDHSETHDVLVCYDRVE